MENLSKCQEAFLLGVKIRKPMNQSTNCETQRRTGWLDVSPSSECTRGF